jgi:hypothetical protein
MIEEGSGNLRESLDTVGKVGERLELLGRFDETTSRSPGNPRRDLWSPKAWSAPLPDVVATKAHAKAFTDRGDREPVLSRGSSNAEKPPIRLQMGEAEGSPRSVIAVTLPTP